MDNKTAVLVLFFTLSCIIARNDAKNNQIEALSRIYKEKLKSDTDIDKSHFDIGSGAHFHAKRVLRSQAGLKEKDRIERLPGQPEVKFKQYGGYVTVDHKAGRAFYYYFAEAQVLRRHCPFCFGSMEGPVVLLLPTEQCKSSARFVSAAMAKRSTKTNMHGTMVCNIIQTANVLFLESPAGVGFSYSNTTSDFMSGGDKRTAIDNYVFLINWLERFPEYKNRDFYISGESYAGHYVPQLAHTILQHNQKANNTVINLKGIIIGNAVINDETDNIGMFEYFRTHALISYDNADQIAKHCDFSPNATKVSDACNEAITEADANTEKLDIYNIYAPMCSNTNLTDKPKKASIMSPDPCSDNYVYAYLNRRDVQKALHANVTNIPYNWQPCSNVLKKWTDSPLTIIPLLKECMANGVRVWVFSGDIDGRVPVTSTQLSIKEMRIPIKTQWYPWFLSGEVGGYTTVYNGNLTFATVRGAGHQVPSYKPDRALSLIVHFLAGTKLPNSSIN